MRPGQDDQATEENIFEGLDLPIAPSHSPIIEKGTESSLESNALPASGHSGEGVDLQQSIADSALLVNQFEPLNEHSAESAFCTSIAPTSTATSIKEKSSLSLLYNDRSEAEQSAAYPALDSPPSRTKSSASSAFGSSSSSTSTQRKLNLGVNEERKDMDSGLLVNELIRENSRLAGEVARLSSIVKNTQRVETSNHNPAAAAGGASHANSLKNNGNGNVQQQQEAALQYISQQQQYYKGEITLPQVVHDVQNSVNQTAAQRLQVS